MKTILCYGDSNTYAYDPNQGWRSRYPKDKRWVNILGAKLGENFELHNCGLNGRTTAYDRPGFPWKNGLTPYASIAGMFKPIDIVIFMLGTNDVNTELGLSAEDIAAGMEKLIVTAQNIAVEQQTFVPEIILVAPAVIGPTYADSPFSDSLDITSVQKSYDIVPLYRSIAERYNCHFVDASELVEVSDIDAEHLTENGHRTLADLIYTCIINNRLDK